ncbi:MAG: signal recognition particle-docking protein FtsY [Rhodobacteraceae bacterium]|jgi:fused signal recognition particle receptor|nr:signal recognition particle-docking protein FtsY [Paracoccaceae bacterium]MDB3961574.1 signal recognition particle-docking protein FtsY [Paracoccaceae bacterium]|tara:strand:+ start:16350 stop:17891 length:1542 start_codon:yes stop_codon:yes gene_type:complete
MAFFKKLKDRLFRSSSKLEDGLDSIVAEGGSLEQNIVENLQTSAEASVLVDTEQQSASIDEADPSLGGKKPLDDHFAAQSDQHISAPSFAPQAKPIEAVDAPLTDSAPAQQGESLKATSSLTSAQGSAGRAMPPTVDPMTEEMAQDQAQIMGKTDTDLGVDADRIAAAPAAGERDTDTVVNQAAASQAAQPLSNETAPEEGSASKPTAAAQSGQNQSAPGFFGRLMGRVQSAGVLKRKLDDEMLEQLEELLITSDMGVDTALRVTGNIAEGQFGKRLSVAELKSMLADEITRIMDPVARPMPLYAQTPQVVLVVGVNGSGKTTTIGKLASQFKAAGKSVVIAAGDTFRAAAVEQLQIWGERAGVPVLTAPEGSDPASLAFDAMTQAQADGADLLLIDTAGRLQNRADLMEELAKIVRVIRKKDPEAPHNTLLVLDATTGQNALSQVEIFKSISDVSGLVMTKLDGTAKGGVLVALADKFGLPIHAIGVGEQIDDLAPFDPAEFASALTGADLS